MKSFHYFKIIMIPVNIFGETMIMEVVAAVEVVEVAAVEVVAVAAVEVAVEVVEVAVEVIAVAVVAKKVKNQN